MFRRMQVFHATNCSVREGDYRNTLYCCISMCTLLEMWRDAFAFLGINEMFTAEKTELWTMYIVVGLKQLITSMRVPHVGCSIHARTFGRAEFSQNSKVCNQLSVWNLLWSQSLSFKLSKCKIFRD
jgi:hypothetical protein